MALREQGYALLEFAPTHADNPPEGLALSYVLDQTDDSNLYRLTLLIGTQSITRPYLIQNGRFAPAGYWVRKETP